jgi:pimeloyl-ACP methyl ester carboxylesterase
VTAQVPAELWGQLRQHRIVGRGGGGIAVVELGPAEAPAWLLAHGAGSSARFVAAACAEPVLAAGRRLIAYDLRGHGASDPAPHVEDHHLDVHAADLLAVADASSGVLEVVGGVSLGAHAAIRALGERSAPLRHVSAAVACLPAWTGASIPGHGPHAANAHEVRSRGVPAMIDRLRSAEGLPGWLRETLLTDYARHDPASLSATLQALDGGQAPDEAELRALPIPLGVVGWRDDPGHPWEVAQRWAELASASPVVALALSELEGDLQVLGRRALHAGQSAAARRHA